MNKKINVGHLMNWKKHILKGSTMRGWIAHDLAQHGLKLEHITPFKDGDDTRYLVLITCNGKFYQTQIAYDCFIDPIAWPHVCRHLAEKVRRSHGQG